MLDMYPSFVCVCVCLLGWLVGWSVGSVGLLGLFVEFKSVPFSEWILKHRKPGWTGTIRRGVPH